MELMHSRSKQVFISANGMHPTVFVKDESSGNIQTILVTSNNPEAVFNNVFDELIRGLRQKYPNHSWIGMSLVIEPLPRSEATEILLTTVQQEGGPMMMIYTEFDISSGSKVQKDISTLSEEQMVNLPQMCPVLFEECSARDGRWCSE